ncbi:MAG: DHHA1 domain-containing protein, partial [Candidatus Hydrothermarchaeaceae archaeon]
CTRVVRDLTKSASELTFKYFGKGVDHLNRIALYGAISDYCDETDFVREELCFYDKRTIYLEAGLLSQSLGESRSDYGFKREIMKNLASGKEPNSIPGVVENAINSAKKEWVVYERIKDIVRVVGDLAIIDNIEKGVSAGKAAKFSIGITEKNIGVGIRVRHDFADISVRKKGNFPMDLDLVLRSIAFRLGGSGGGHASAAGARIPSRNIDEFIRTLADEVASIS